MKVTRPEVGFGQQKQLDEWIRGFWNRTRQKTVKEVLETEAKDILPFLKDIAEYHKVSFHNFRGLGTFVRRKVLRIRLEVWIPIFSPICIVTPKTTRLHDIGVSFLTVPSLT